MSLDSSTSGPASAASPARISIVLAFLSIYLCWGATYTAARVGVRLLPPTILAGTRLMIGATIMLTACALRKKRLIWDRGVMVRLALLGMLMLFGGNIGLVWGEKYLPSGLAALIVAVMPLYVALIEMLMPGGERLKMRGFAGLALGLAALAALLWPGLRESFRHGLKGEPIEIVASVVLLLGALSFAFGSVLARRMRLPVDPLVAAGWEMLTAGAVNIVLATATWQWPQAVWNVDSVGAIAYLVIFGSLLGFSCYVWLLSHVPAPKVATYAYVNPVVAVILGALLLHERLEPSEYVGMAAVVAAVALVTSSQLKSGKSAAEIECAKVESEA